MWLHCIYPRIREPLAAALSRVKKRYLTEAHKAAKAPHVKSPHLRLWRSRYTHLLNLQLLFEFFIPTVQDYGLSFKLNDFQNFKSCLYRLFLLFLTLNTPGSHMYTRGLYFFLVHLSYWEQENVCVPLLILHFVLATYRVTLQAQPDCAF